MKLSKTKVNLGEVKIKVNFILLTRFNLCVENVKNEFYSFLSSFLIEIIKETIYLIYMGSTIIYNTKNNYYMFYIRKNVFFHYFLKTTLLNKIMHVLKLKLLYTKNGHDRAKFNEVFLLFSA